MFPRIALLLVVSFAFFSEVSLEAQSRFRIELTGAEEVPPVVTAGGGWGRFALEPDGTLSYEAFTWGLVGIGAELRVGESGQEGPVLFTLEGGPTRWAGQTAPLDANQIDSLRTRKLYVSVQTAAHPEGEVRSQVLAGPVRFGVHLTGDQAPFPSDSLGTGEGSLFVHDDLSVEFHIEYRDLFGAPLLAHLHDADFGQHDSAPIIFHLCHPGNCESPLTGRTDPLTPEQFATMQELGTMVLIHTEFRPQGEIRGQVIPSGLPYGIGCERPTGTPTLSSEGAPYQGGTVRLDVQGGRPSGIGFLHIAVQGGAILTRGCPYLLGPPIANLPLVLDVQGRLGLSTVMPVLDAPLVLYMQFVGMDDEASNGLFYRTNALEYPISVF